MRLDRDQSDIHLQMALDEQREALQNASKKGPNGYNRLFIPTRNLWRPKNFFLLALVLWAAYGVVQSLPIDWAGLFG